MSRSNATGAGIIVGLILLMVALPAILLAREFQDNRAVLRCMNAGYYGVERHGGDVYCVRYHRESTIRVKSKEIGK